MKQILWATALMPSLISGFGCAMCENCLDYDPPAYGGICEDASCGRRAGSIIAANHGEAMTGGKFSQEEVIGSEGPQPTAAEPPMPEDIPFPQDFPLEPAEPPAESAVEGLSQPGFPEIPAPVESSADPLLTPSSEAPLPLNHGATTAPPLLPDLLPNPGSGTTPGR